MLEFQSIMDKFQKSTSEAIRYLRSDIAKYQIGRANLSILDNICIDYYDVSTPINYVAQLSVPNARLIIIRPIDLSIINKIEKAIQAANIGLVPQNAGNVIRLQIPMLTEERRKELVKQANRQGENTKIAIRNLRRDFNYIIKELKQSKKISEDDMHYGLNKIQKETDEAVLKIDEIIKVKELEIIEDA